MTVGIRAMKDLGFINVTGKHDERLFKRVDDEGHIFDTINYFYESITGVAVFTNDLKRGDGCLLDKDLLNAIMLNFVEFENEIHYKLLEEKGDLK